ncbi:40S ribosomal protein S29 [Lemmus lemmus]
MGHQQLYWSHPRKFGQGSRSPPRLLKPSRSDPEIWAEHVSPVFPAVREGHRLH